MTITRHSVADEIDRLDAQISELQTDKRGIYETYRAQMEKDGAAKSAIKVEVEALKLAIRQRRELTKDENVVIERGALVEEILTEIRKVGTKNATRAHARRTREGGTDDIPEFLQRGPPPAA